MGLGVFLLLLNISCSGNNNNNVEFSHFKNKYINYYAKIYHKYKVAGFNNASSNEKCKVAVDLNNNEEKIIWVHTNCMQHLSFNRFMDDFIQIIKHFHLERQLQKSDIIKVSTFQGIVAFPNFVKYFNKQPKEVKKIFTYSSTDSFKEVSNSYHRKLAKLIKDSNLYIDKIESLAIKNCTAKVDFSYWMKDKTLYTVPKSIMKYHIIAYKVINANDINFASYPDIPYLPVKIKCR